MRFNLKILCRLIRDKSNKIMEVQCKDNPINIQKVMDWDLIERWMNNAIISWK